MRIELTGRFRIDQEYPNADSGFHFKFLDGSRKGKYSKISDSLMCLIFDDEFIHKAAVGRQLEVKKGKENLLL